MCLQDPLTVTATITRIGGAAVTISVTRVSQGIYTSTYQWTTVGVFAVTFTGAGNYPFVSEKSIAISPLAA